MKTAQPLDTLAKRQPATIISLVAGELEQRLLEMGFVEGRSIMILHEAPFTKDPIIVRLQNNRIALRRKEAHCILVEANES